MQEKCLRLNRFQSKRYTYTKVRKYKLLPEPIRNCKKVDVYDSVFHSISKIDHKKVCNGNTLLCNLKISIRYYYKKSIDIYIYI